MKAYRVFGIALIAVLAFSPSIPAVAVTAGNHTSTMAAHAPVVPSCSNLPTVVNFSFSPYDVFASNGQFASGGSSTINCTKGAQPTWAFDNGTYGVASQKCGTFHCRYMGNAGGARIEYVAVACYSPAQINGTSLADLAQYCTGMDQADATSVPVPAANGNGTQETVNLFFYAFLPPKQDVPIGSYSDSFVMTLNY
ncbi:MAG: spore coat protein U domain-containing protein [Candidatus Eremiobacteraeota bacterium]|nr:spore coat protein U domain-containing protein [Candidatus Eremiobacteraeota bacterium]